MTNTTDWLRINGNWRHAPSDWPPMTTAERQALAQRLEDSKQPDAGKDNEQ